MDVTMKNISLALLLVTSLLSGQASAGNIQDARVTWIRVDSSGIGMVFFDKTIASSPTCINATAYKNALAFDSNTSGGKSILSSSIAAKAMGAVVVAYGKNTCAIFNGAHVEDMDYMIFGL